MKRGPTVSKLVERKLCRSQDQEIIFSVYSLKKMEAGQEIREKQLKERVPCVVVSYSSVRRTVADVV